MDNEKIIDITENTTEAEAPETEVKEKEKKSKKISINSFDKIMKETYTPTETVAWHGVDIIVKKNLSLQEVLEFVESVVQLCFEGESGKYLPEVRDFAIKLNVLTKYANFTMPRNINHQYQLIYCTDAFETVIKRVNILQFNEMCYSIDRRLDYSASAQVYDMEKRMNDLINGFSDLEGKMAQVYGDVSGEQMVGLIDAIQGGKLDEKKLVDAYFDRKEGVAESEE